MALTRLAETIPGGHVLEIGSGPGWDADQLEEAGLTVRRTDITQAFIDFQRARGKQVDRLDAINDDLGGPYDAVVTLHVLQHVEPGDLPAVLAKVAGALRPGGRFLVSIPLGEGAGWEVGESGSPYYRALWSEADFLASSRSRAWSRSGPNGPSPTRRAAGSACWLSGTDRGRPRNYATMGA